ncbi:hypothetical protein NKW84_03520 [Acetobacter senegalensis]|uniref:hypothetical protein n=1 Tax=Acetobacter senegalensis TaxID=446692 RepID=UPI00209CC62B|nr:hypothetical protein [Acetobacter senegalensis]MCP1194931.1 hypothetical protein [Acetobacter senegalensis]
MKTARQGSAPKKGAKNRFAGLLFCLLAGLIAAGLYRSFQVAAFLPLDADRATPAVVAEAMLAHGLDALNAWHSTQDNWLLSAILPQFPFYALLGQQAWIPALCGWLGFVASCALCGVLVALAAAPRPSGWLVGMGLFGVLLFLNPLALGPIGFLAHPVSHGVTCFWGLAALVPCVLVLKGRSRWLLALTTVLLLVASISDPWARAAFVLPLTLAGVGLCLLPSDARQKKTALCLIASTLPVWLAGAHGFGLFPGIPGTQFTKGALADIPHHAALGFSGIAVLLHLVPGTSALSQPLARRADIVVLVVLAALSGVSLAYACRKKALHTLVFLALFCGFSLVVTFSAFSLSAFATDLNTTRLLAQFAFLVPLLLALTLLCSSIDSKPASTNKTKTGTRQHVQNRLAPGFRYALACTSVGFVLAGAFPTSDMLSTTDDSTARTKRLLAFLKSNALSHGYGAYWATHANTSHLLSAVSVTLRPVALKGGNLIQPRDEQVFDAWYRPEDHALNSRGTQPPAAVREFFIALPDQELCANREACMDLAHRSFGPPDETVMWENTPVMIWHKALFPPEPLAENRQRAPELLYDPAQNAAIAVTPQTAPAMLWRGWASVGPDGAWSGAQLAGIMVRLTGPSAPLCLTMRASGRSSAPPQPVTLLRDGTAIAQWAVHAGTPAPYCTGPLPAGDAYLVLERAAPPHDNQRLLPGILLSTLSRPHG